MRTEVRSGETPLLVVGRPDPSHEERWQGYAGAFAGVEWSVDPLAALHRRAGEGTAYALVAFDPEIVLDAAIGSRVERAISHAERAVTAWGMLAAGGLDIWSRPVDHGQYLGRTTLPAEPDLVPLALPYPRLALVALERMPDGALRRSSRPDITLALAMIEAGVPAYASPHLRFGRLERRGAGPAGPAPHLPVLGRIASDDEWRVVVAAATDHEPPDEDALEGLGRIGGIVERAATVARAARPDATVSVVVRTALDRPGLLRRNLLGLRRAAERGPLHEVLLVSTRPDVAAEAERLADGHGLPLRGVASEPGHHASRSANLEAGAASATGDYVWFVDDDDVVEPGCLEHIQRMVFTDRRPLLVVGARVVTERWDEERSTAVRAEETGMYPGPDWFAGFHGSNRFPICAAVYPRPLLERVDWERVVSHGLSEDYALFLDAVGRTDFARMTPAVAATISLRPEGDSADNVVTRLDLGWLEELVGVTADAFSGDGMDRVRMGLAAAASQWWLTARRQEGEMSGLRDHIAHLEDHAADLQREVWRLERAAERDSQARADLKWLLQRLRRSPLGAVLRRRSGFERLWERWGEDR